MTGTNQYNQEDGNQLPFLKQKFYDMLTLIDENIPIQIIASQYYEPVDELNIHLTKFLGRGGQAEVYEC